MMTCLIPKIFYARMEDALDLFAGCLGFAVLHRDQALAAGGSPNRSHVDALSSMSRGVGSSRAWGRGTGLVRARVIAALLPILLGGAALPAASAAARASCERDTDCKLIYSSCLCEAVAASDTRRSLPSEVDCTVNRCRVEHTRAVCRDRECMTQSDPEQPRSR